MLAQLSIRDIVLIERLDLEFSAGLSVLTGETGAESRFFSTVCRSRSAGAVTVRWCVMAWSGGR